MRPNDDYDEDIESQEIDYEDDDSSTDEEEDDKEEDDERPITDVDIFGDISDMIDDVDGDSCCRPKTSREEDEEERPRTGIDFSLLKDDELLLPYSYIISDREQWEHVLRACETGFRSVKDMGKVSDKVLSLVADVAALVLERGGGTITNERFVQYAEQRGV